MAELLRGAPVARAIAEGLAARVDALRARGVEPRLAVVRAGEREDDLAYERAAERRCLAAGIAFQRVVLEAGNIDQAALEARFTASCSCGRSRRPSTPPPRSVASLPRRTWTAPAPRGFSPRSPGAEAASPRAPPSPRSRSWTTTACRSTAPT